MPPYDLPPVQNRIVYVYRVLIKLFFFFFFGFSSIILVVFVLPPMRLFIHPKEKFKKNARLFVSVSFRFFIGLMHSFQVLDLEAGNREMYRRLSSKVVVANHPSLIDVVMLFSLIPNADCIVAGHLNHSIVKGIVRWLYILNSQDFDDILKACDESLKYGNCIVIFPEGTRTPRNGSPVVKKGAARIALACGCGIIPLHIGGTDKYGLGKKDPWTAFNPRERYVYEIKMGTEILPEKYKSLPKPVAVRALTREIASSIFPVKNT
jgi:1-acyl-sn-glycerol-3-phosphate acyltransferase